MTRKLLVALAIVTLSASAATAAHRHHHALNSYNAAPEPTAPAPPPLGWMGGANSNDRAMYLKNLHDSGYNPQSDRDANGNVATQ